MKNIIYTKNFTKGILKGGDYTETQQGVSEFSLKQIRDLERTGQILNPAHSSSYFITDVRVTGEYSHG